MRNPFRAILERDQRRWETHGVKAWERQRAKGKWLFVLKFGFLWGLMMTAGISLIEYFLDGRIRVETLWLKVPMNLTLGLISASVLWSYTERKYEKYIRAVS